MKLNEFVKMHKNFTKGMKTLNEESIEDFAIRKPTQGLGDSEVDSSGEEMTFTPEETTTRCFSQMGHKVSFNDAVTLLFDYLGQKNLANFATIAIRDEDSKCDQDLVAAIQIAQEDLGLKVDGIMGRNTISTLRNATLDPDFLSNTDKDKKPENIPNTATGTTTLTANRNTNFLKENIDEVSEYCKLILNTPLELSSVGIVTFQRSCGFHGRSQVDGKIGPMTMTAIVLVCLAAKQEAPMSEHKINPNSMFNISSKSLREKTELSLNFILKEDSESVNNFIEEYSKSSTFLERFANVYSIMKSEKPDIPSINKLGLSYDPAEHIEENYTIHEGIGISNELSQEKIGILKQFITQIGVILPDYAIDKANVIAILSVCGKESSWDPKSQEGTNYSAKRFKKDLINLNKYEFDRNNKELKLAVGAASVVNRIRKIWNSDLGPGRDPNNKEISQLTGGNRNGIALMNLAYSHKRASNVLPNPSIDLRALSADGSRVNPDLYNKNLPGYKYRGRGMIQITFKEGYKRVENEAEQMGGEVGKLLAGITDDPELILQSPIANVMASLLFLRSRKKMFESEKLKQYENESRMENLIRKAASPVFGKPIETKSSRGMAQIHAAAKKTKYFIIIEEETK